MSVVAITLFVVAGFAPIVSASTDIGPEGPATAQACFDPVPGLIAEQCFMVNDEPLPCVWANPDVGDCD